METFTPIAMKCTKEQFEAVSPKLIGLKIKSISPFSDYNYLVNNLWGELKLISNVPYHHNGSHNRKVYEEWNEEIFLKSCGIEVETLKHQLEKELLNNKNMVDLMGYSVLVDNEEQARKLQEIAFEQGFKWVDGAEELDLFSEESFQFGYNGKKVITYNYGGNHYQDNFITKIAHFNDLFKVKEETLQEKSIRLENELKEVNKQIEEENRPKVGDWIKIGYSFTRKRSKGYYQDEIKITNPEFIKLLEQEIK